MTLDLLARFLGATLMVSLAGWAVAVAAWFAWSRMLRTAGLTMAVVCYGLHRTWIRLLLQEPKPPACLACGRSSVPAKLVRDALDRIQSGNAAEELMGEKALREQVGWTDQGLNFKPCEPPSEVEGQP